jgi:GNAT superfamily N-acetyltransferase
LAKTRTTTSGTATTEELRTARLTEAHAAAGYELSAEAGWNQTVEDWRLMLGDGEAIGQLGPDGRLVASALLLPYGDRLAWISMVLTTADFRRRGLATANLRWALERCRARGLAAGLDATPAGSEVYRPLGFVEICGLQRLRAERPAVTRPSRGAVAIRPLQAARDLDAIARLDAAVFGIERRSLLSYLRRNQPQRALLAEAEGELAGLALARAGRNALHIGPLVARNPTVARLLLAQALVGASGPVSIDVPDRQSAFLDMLQSAGFAPVRPFTRMIQGATEAPGDMATCIAIAGPEFG